MAALAGLSQDWLQRFHALTDKNAMAIVNAFIGDTSVKDFFYQVTAVQAPRGWPENQHLQITILGAGDRDEKMIWTVVPTSTMRAAHLYNFGHMMLQRLGHVQQHRRIRLRNASSLAILDRSRVVWNPMWMLPKRRLFGKASRLGHTIKLRTKRL